MWLAFGDYRDRLVLFAQIVLFHTVYNCAFSCPELGIIQYNKLYFPRLHLHNKSLTVIRIRDQLVPNKFCSAFPFILINPETVLAVEVNKSTQYQQLYKSSDMYGHILTNNFSVGKICVLKHWVNWSFFGCQNKNFIGLWLDYKRNDFFKSWWLTGEHLYNVIFENHNQFVKNILCNFLWLYGGILKVFFQIDAVI